eukprot:UC4_evm7s1341
MLQYVRQNLGETIPWFLYYGTLLGSVREQGHISHETDIDIMVPANQWNAMEKLLQSGLVNESFVYKFYPGRLPFARLFFGTINKVHVDIWSYKNLSYKNASSNHHGLVRLLHDQKEGTHIISSSLIFPLTSCIYGGNEYLCPRSSAKILAHQYGPSWKISKRKYGPASQYSESEFNSKPLVAKVDAQN